VAADKIQESELKELLTEYELQATVERLTQIIASRKFAVPNDEWPSLPWPLF
jgi:hypothetical protein